MSFETYSSHKMFRSNLYRFLSEKKASLQV